MTPDERYAQIAKYEAEIEKAKAAGHTKNTIAGIETLIAYQKRMLIDELGEENVNFGSQSK